MSVISNERGLNLMWCQTNVVSTECGAK